MSSSPAAIAAVPFLTDVVADPAAPSRFAACQVLLQIAIGEEEITLNERTDFAFWRREAERKAGLTVEQLRAEQAAWVAAATDPAERRAREVAVRFRDVEEEREAERVNAEAYDAVRAGVPVYLTALSAGDTATRIYAAQLLAYFPEDAPVIVPALLALVAGNDPVTAAAAFAEVLGDDVDALREEGRLAEGGALVVDTGRHRVLEDSGPVPWHTKYPLYRDLAVIEALRPAIFRGLLASYHDAHGDLDPAAALQLLDALRLAPEMPHLAALRAVLASGVVNHHRDPRVWQSAHHGTVPAAN